MPTLTVGNSLICPELQKRPQGNRNPTGVARRSDVLLSALLHDLLNTKGSYVPERSRATRCFKHGEACPINPRSSCGWIHDNPFGWEFCSFRRFILSDFVGSLRLVNSCRFVRLSAPRRLSSLAPKVARAKKGPRGDL